MAKMSDNARLLLRALQDLEGKQVTHEDVSEITGLAPRSIVAIFNSFVKKGWGEREEVVVELEDGTEKKVKFLKLTNVGMVYNPNLE